MKIFELKTKCGETINKINAIGVDEAIEIFAKIKNLKINSLLELFIITESL
jgi:uncharacterized protein (DUF1810 family)